MDLMLPGTSNFAAGFKGGHHGPITKMYQGIPYCDGTGAYYAPDCHSTVPAGDA